MTPTFSIPDTVCAIIQRLESHGYEAYAVGGCVRDMLCGRTPHDWDLCTSALPQEICEYFSDYPLITTGEKHGTIAVLRDSVPYEITTYRIDGTYADGRHPEQVYFVRSLREDLRRRDFTINAMAYHPQHGLVDLYHGAADLQQKIIRCVGKPEQRFREDALRILRGLRFAAVYAMQLDPETARASHLLAPTLRQISVERIASECCKLLAAPDPTVILRAFSDVWMLLFPELESVPWEQALSRIKAVPAECVLRWAACLYDIPSKTARNMLLRLHMERKQIQEITALLQLRNTPVPETTRDMRRLLLTTKPSMLQKHILLWAADQRIPKAQLQRAQQCLTETLASPICFRLKDLAVSGADLLEIGIKKGPRIGVILHTLLQMTAAEILPNQREPLLQEAKVLSVKPLPLPEVQPLQAHPLRPVPPDGQVPDSNDSDNRGRTPEIPHHSS